MKKTYVMAMFVMITAQALAQPNKRDTTFLLRENGLYYHAIYVEKDTASAFYDDFINNKHSAWAHDFYNGHIYLLKTKAKLSTYNANEIVRNWHPLYQYKNEYYVYYPSDGINNNWLIINDSVLLRYAAGEMMPYAIQGLEKNDKNVYAISYVALDGNRGSVNIHLIEPERGIALFEYPNEAPDYRYELMVATNKARQFPMIVNYCKEGKQEDWVFDTPNYQRLLQNQRQINK